MTTNQMIAAFQAILAGKDLPNPFLEVAKPSKPTRKPKPAKGGRK